MVKIFIDPGHGGTDPGAVGNGLYEKNLTLKISQDLKRKLDQYEGVETRLSRSDDRTLTLQQRTTDANNWGADYFVSVHINAGGGTGFESFIFNGPIQPTTQNYHNVMHAAMIKELGNVRDRGKKRANFHVVRETKMPAILPEFLFIDNPNDARLLKDSKFIDSCSTGIENGFVTLLSLKKKNAPKPSSNEKYHTVKKGDTFWGLAQQYNTSVMDLQALNPEVKANSLPIGYKLKISGNTEVYHTVVRGDTVSGIASKYKTTINNIKKLNPSIENINLIYPGQKIRVK